MKLQLPLFFLSLLLGSGAIAPSAHAKPPSNIARPAGHAVLSGGTVEPGGATVSVGAIVPDANSQIPITGGVMAGDAAFFKHYIDLAYEASLALYLGYPFRFPEFDPPLLFDAAVRNLRIETPRGITTTSRFIPISSRFIDTNANSKPDKGDTGQLQGVLSGVAFLPNGTPFFFQGIPTRLSFTLNSFVPTATLWGNLIKPQDATSDAPLFFIGQRAVDLSPAASQLYTVRPGFLTFGSFTADLNGDFIKLPASLEFRPVGNIVDLPLPILGQQIRFELQGEGVFPKEIYPYPIWGIPPQPGGRFAITTQTTSFKVQTISNMGAPEFQIEGTLGDISISLYPLAEVRSVLFISGGGSINYRVQGEQRGYVTLGRNNATGQAQASLISIADGSVSFRFQQSDRWVEGVSQRANIYWAAGEANTFGSVLMPITGLRSPIPPYSITPIVPTPGSSLPPANLSGQVIADLVTGAPVTSTNPVATYINRFTFPLEARADSPNNSQSTYTLYRSQGPVSVEVQWLDGDRLILVERQSGGMIPAGSTSGQGRIVAAYQMVGLPSRVFPGLMGVRQIPTDQMQSLISPQSTEPANTLTAP